MCQTMDGKSVVTRQEEDVEFVCVFINIRVSNSIIGRCLKNEIQGRFRGFERKECTTYPYNRGLYR